MTPLSARGYLDKGNSLKSGKPIDSLVFFDCCINLNPEDDFLIYCAYFDKAVALCHLKRFNESIESAKNACICLSDPTSSQLASMHELKGWIYNKFDMFRRAEKEYRAEIEVCSSIKAYENLSYTLMRLSKYSEVIERIQKAVQLYLDVNDKLISKLLVTMAHALCELKRWDEALSVSDDNLKTYPINFRTTYFKTFALIGLVRREEALAMMEKLSPDSADDHSDMGWLWCCLKEPDKSLAEVNIAIKMDPAHDFAHVNRTNALLLQENWEEAYHHSHSIRKFAAYPQNVDLNISESLTGLGKFEEGVVYADKALAAQPNDAGMKAAVHCLKSFAFTGMNRFNDALMHAEEALRFDPYEPESRFYKSLALSGMGRLNEARIEIEAALNINPNYLKYLKQKEALKLGKIK